MKLAVWIRIPIVLSVIWIVAEAKQVYSSYYLARCIRLDLAIIEQCPLFPFQKFYDTVFCIILFWGVLWVVHGIWLWYRQKAKK
jgi:hypothetical protein